MGQQQVHLIVKRNPQQKYYKNNDTNTNKHQSYNHGNNYKSDNYNSYHNNHRNRLEFVKLGTPPLKMTDIKTSTTTKLMTKM